MSPEAIGYHSGLAFWKRYLAGNPSSSTCRRLSLQLLREKNHGRDLKDTAMQLPNCNLSGADVLQWSSCTNHHWDAAVTEPMLAQSGVKLSYPSQWLFTGLRNVWEKVELLPFYIPHTFLYNLDIFRLTPTSPSEIRSYHEHHRLLQVLCE